MSDDHRRADTHDDQHESNEEQHARGDEIDTVNGIWASISASTVEEQATRSVESFKERLKRGAAHRRSAPRDDDGD